jgi:hypothetical protein
LPDVIVGSGHIVMATQGGRHASGGMGWLPLFAVTFLAAFAFLVAAGVIELHVSGPSDAARGQGPSGSKNGGSVGGASTSAPTATDHSTGSSESAGCKELWANELRVALAAERTLQEWRLHIETMDELVAGKISIEDANVFWDESEHGALGRIERFKRLDADLRSSPTNCDIEDPTGPTGACADAAQAVERTIDVARTAVDTWKHHIREMARLRAGEITEDEAIQSWHRLWRTGQVQTVRYDHRAAKALAHDCS